MKKILLLIFVAVAMIGCTKNDELNDELSTLWVYIAQGQLLSKADYTTASWTPFASALAHAKVVAGSSSPTVAVVRDANIRLETAMTKLVSRADALDNLRTAITVASAWKNDGYTTDSWNAFQTALTDAKAVRDYTPSTADELQGALDRLMEAFDGLKK